MENMERRRQRQNLTRHEEALLYILLYILLSVPCHNHRTVLGQVNHELPSRFEHLIIQKLIGACNQVSNVTKLEIFKLTWESHIRGYVCSMHGRIHKVEGSGIFIQRTTAPVV